MKQTTIYIPDKLRELIDQEAEYSDMSKVIRLGVEFYIYHKRFKLKDKGVFDPKREIELYKKFIGE